MKPIITQFIEAFKNINKDSRTNARYYNNGLKNYKFVVLHPFILLEDKLVLLVMFTNENRRIWPLGEDLQNEAYQYFDSLRTSHNFIDYTDDDCEIDETIYIETSLFSEIEMETPTWEQMLNSPKIEDGEFYLLAEPFNQYFNLENNFKIDYNEWVTFSNENKPDNIELRVVWKDVDSRHKYGDIITLIFWDEQFIGWVSGGGKWIDSHVYYTVNPALWREFMNYLYSHSGLGEIGLNLHGVNVIDMKSTQVENVMYVHGFSDKNYGE